MCTCLRILGDSGTESLLFLFFALGVLILTSAIFVVEFLCYLANDHQRILLM